MALQDLAGVRVLVVEDTADSREMLRMALEYCGAFVTTAASAEEAKRVLESVRPHVLVSDIAMPDDGVELIREAKAVAEAKGLRIPAIAITAYHGRREELLAEGFAELVEKPIDPLTLCGTIRRHAKLDTYDPSGLATFNLALWEKSGFSAGAVRRANLGSRGRPGSRGSGDGSPPRPFRRRPGARPESPPPTTPSLGKRSPRLPD